MTIKRTMRLAAAAIMCTVALHFSPQPTSVEAQGNCPTDSFLNVSNYTPTGYATPTLSVECSASTMTVRSNGIPNFEYVQVTPNRLTQQNYAWQIPLNPQKASAPSQIPLVGAVAIAVNGLPIFGPNEAPFDDYGDPYLDGLLDYCGGHTAPGGVYHFHAPMNCLFSNLQNNPNLIVGYAFDGYPIYAPYICTDPSCQQVREVSSSWQRTQNVRNAWQAHQYVAGSGDLDQCNGMTMPDGSYRYFATDTFPYFLGCYTGVATNHGGQGGGMAGGQGAQGGQPPQAGQGNPPAGLNPPGGRPPRRP
ncbi:MAG: hypothetical protein OHK0023_02790 [Anaerolineae bacterium]